MEHATEKSGSVGSSWRRDLVTRISGVIHQEGLQAGDRLSESRLDVSRETAAIPEHGFAWPPGWLRDMRDRHLEAMDPPWRERSRVSVYETNAAFHARIAAASGHGFPRSAVEAGGNEVATALMRRDLERTALRPRPFPNGRAGTD